MRAATRRRTGSNGFVISNTVTLWPTRRRAIAVDKPLIEPPMMANSMGRKFGVIGMDYWSVGVRRDWQVEVA